jgi:hypothetical protein
MEITYNILDPEGWISFKAAKSCYLLLRLKTVTCKGLNLKKESVWIVGTRVILNSTLSWTPLTHKNFSLYRAPNLFSPVGQIDSLLWCSGPSYQLASQPWYTWRFPSDLSGQLPEFLPVQFGAARICQKKWDAQAINYRGTVQSLNQSYPHQWSSGRPASTNIRPTCLSSKRLVRHVAGLINLPKRHGKP